MGDIQPAHGRRLPQILRTADSGNTWKAQTLPAGLGSLSPGIGHHSEITCPSTTTCYTLGYDPTSGTSVPDMILATTNSGTTWSTLTLPSGAQFVDSISCPSTTTCYKVSGAIGSSVTRDSGKTWKTLTFPAGTSPVLIRCPSTTACYAAVGNGTGYETLMVTTDSGVTWSP